MTSPTWWSTVIDATAKVTYQFDKTPDTKTDVETTFVREDGAWKVCTPVSS